MFPLAKQGWKKMLCGYQGQVDFPAKPITFQSHLPHGPRHRQINCQLDKKKNKPRLAQGKQNLRAAFPKGKLEFTAQDGLSQHSNYY